MLLRNKLYDWKIFHSHRFANPIICIGNLSVGGTGKSPHIEYLVRLLKEKYHIAILSRGYKRDSMGFILASDSSDVNEIGDEPLQFKRKFNDVIVAVDENRREGINQLLKINNLSGNNKLSDKLIVLLDDAYQHRSVKPGLSILLTDFNNLFFQDYVLPSGFLREFRNGYKRADIVIVTKTPQDLPVEKRKIIIEKINPLKHQQVFYSYIKYKTLLPVNPDSGLQPLQLSDLNDYSVFLFAGIANPSVLTEKLKEFCNNVTSDFFKDHHDYSVEDILKIKNSFFSIIGKNKIILTTEKDAMRIIEPKLLDMLVDIPIYYLPIEIEFHNDDKEIFDSLIMSFASESSL